VLVWLGDFPFGVSRLREACARWSNEEGPAISERLAWQVVWPSPSATKASYVEHPWCVEIRSTKLSLRYPPYTHRLRAGRQLHAFAGGDACFFATPLCLRRFPLDPHAGCVVRFSKPRHNRKTLVFPSSQPTRKDGRLANFPGESVRAEPV
jgi:hypothetical protein